MENERLEYFIDLIKQKKLIIGENGRIFKVDHNGNLYPGEHITGYGYYQVNVYLGNYKFINCLSHRLIYAYHHGVDSLKKGMVIHHLDYNKKNNRIENLVQITRKENSCLGDGKNSAKHILRLKERVVSNGK